MNILHLGQGGLPMPIGLQLGLHECTGPPRPPMLLLPILTPLRSSSPGSAEDGPRAVFMVDLWHPNVAAAERQALDFIFAPGR